AAPIIKNIPVENAYIYMVAFLLILILKHDKSPIKSNGTENNISE
ncbi:hypothetical protein CP02DC14_2090, partial [Chlamydia psittaci 02DC14]